MTAQTSEVEDSVAPNVADQKAEEAFGSPPLAMASSDEANAAGEFQAASN
jgi:hypothetical protein